MKATDVAGVCELTDEDLNAVSGGDKAKEAAALEAYRVVARINREENEPDPVQHVSMRL